MVENLKTIWLAFLLENNTCRMFEYERKEACMFPLQSTQLGYLPDYLYHWQKHISSAQDFKTKRESQRGKKQKWERLHKSLNYLTFQLNTQG